MEPKAVCEGVVGHRDHTAPPRGEWARAAPLAHGHLETFGLPISCSCCREARSPLFHFPTLYSFSSHLSGGRGDTTHVFLHRDPFPNCLSGHAAAAGSQTQRGVSKRVKPLPKRRRSVLPPSCRLSPAALTERGRFSGPSQPRAPLALRGYGERRGAIPSYGRSEGAQCHPVTAGPAERSAAVRSRAEPRRVLLGHRGGGG